MTFKTYQLTLAACAAAALLASCGGGGGGGDATATQAPVVVDGTAATGLALANAPVSVKCATGAGNTTTNANGTFSVSIPGAVLPCLVQVTGTVNGNTLTLHSIADTGTTANGSTTVRANVTPLTELITASVLGQSPAQAFQSFTGTGVTSQKITSSITSILAAVKDATGVDLGSIDPLKGSLVAATPSTPAGGNDYDKALDAFAAKVKPESLALITSQIVNSGGTTTLSQLLSTAPGCASAISGRYRGLSLQGAVETAVLDFKNMTVAFNGGTSTAPIWQNPNQACDFSAGGTAFSADASYRFAIGPQGAGAFRGMINNVIANGYIFPEQAATALTDAAGTWVMAQSGIDTDESNPRVNWLSRITITSSGGFSGCDYQESASWTGACTVDATDGAVTTLSPAASTGSLELREASMQQPIGRLWAFRSAAGTTTLYGTTALANGGTQSTSVIFVKQQALALPVAGTVNKSLNFRTVSGPLTQPLVADAPFVSTFTIQSPDAAAGTYTRTGTSGGVSQTDQLAINNPQTGLRVFTARPAVIQLPIAGSGLTLTLDSPNSPSYFRHILSVGLPN